MVTPRVVQEVRTHFGCPNLEGAELEDQVHLASSYDICTIYEWLKLTIFLEIIKDRVFAKSMLNEAMYNYALL